MIMDPAVIYMETKKVSRVSYNPEAIEQTVNSYNRVKSFNKNTIKILDNLRMDIYKLYVGHIKFIQEVFHEKLLKSEQQTEEVIKWAIEKINQLKSYLIPLERPDEINSLTYECINKFSTFNES